MKTAVSIPDGVFAEAETLARRAKCSRSEVYARALSEYVARHAPDRVTEAMDRVLAQVDEAADKFPSRAARRTLERTEW
jgi:metal-responsive CopG/Arc/MetJ family transcriptional regulator